MTRPRIERGSPAAEAKWKKAIKSRHGNHSTIGSSFVNHSISHNERPARISPSEFPETCQVEYCQVLNITNAQAEFPHRNFPRPVKSNTVKFCEGPIELGIVKHRRNSSSENFMKKKKTYFPPVTRPRIERGSPAAEAKWKKRIKSRCGNHSTIGSSFLNHSISDNQLPGGISQSEFPETCQVEYCQVKLHEEKNDIIFAYDPTPNQTGASCCREQIQKAN
ncbi:hypothetical protein B0H17DRAFT_1126974 [Mycena rosella]|uniref:Uncharacterized protein n=1 Tax=Mycena rosella TaxID=1033263 RepID=A0AAD7GS03_MYCRO|nr:hypothetical protein B0H17DRAFT_1126974 [Mycena rosella]